MTTAAPFERMGHAGDATTQLRLKDIGEFTVSTHMYTACLSPDKRFIVAVEQSGSLTVLHRRSPEDAEVVRHSIIHTNYGFCCFVAIDNDARFILLADCDGCFHIFSRHINDWEQEPLSLQIGLFQQAARTFTATLVESRDAQKTTWVLMNSLEKHRYILSRRSRLWRGFKWNVETAATE